MFIASEGGTDSGQSTDHSAPVAPVQLAGLAAASGHGPIGGRCLAPSTHPLDVGGGHHEPSEAVQQSQAILQLIGGE